MFIIADSGSTKTDWRIVSPDGKIIALKSAGLNPFFTSVEEMKFIVSSTFSNINVNEIKEIYFYGAGCINNDKCNIIKQSLKSVFPDAIFEINTDLLGAARALFGKESGVAAILGTGCNSGFYDGAKIAHNVSPLGYILGDEGSGAYLGKEFVKGIMRGYFPKDFCETFFMKNNLSGELILSKVYKEPFANRFLAGFTMPIKENIDKPFIEDLVISCFRDFFRNIVCRYSDKKIYSLGVVGSVGFCFQDQLRVVAEENKIKISKIIIAPADELVLFHGK